MIILGMVITIISKRAMTAIFSEKMWYELNAPQRQVNSFIMSNQGVILLKEVGRSR